MKPKIFAAYAGLLLSATAADIVQSDVSAAFPTNGFFIDDAVPGGGDNNSANLAREFSGFWTAEAMVTLRGLGWASSAGGTTATQATVTFTDLGADETFGTADDVVIAAVTDDLTFSGAGEYLWVFDEPVTFTALGGAIRMDIAANGNVRRKTRTNADTSAAEVKLSLAGTAVGGIPPARRAIATTSGFWDSLSWEDSSGSAVATLADQDEVVVGNYHTVTYRGVPADERVGEITLGRSAGDAGQSTLRVASGSLTVGGDLLAGRNDPFSDAFVEVNGGELRVEGNGEFGTVVEGCDGSLMLAGGSARFEGDLTMGGFEAGGSMLRIQNPGMGSLLTVDGNLRLMRTALDLTFDDTYQHTEGQVITIATYAGREGQFVNFREGDDFNCGPHRFEIHYDVPSDGGQAITLTALAPWHTQENPPHIVFFFSDDQGYADTSLNGHPEWGPKYPMPELEGIANRGVRFTDAYVTAGVCHPSRCGILSGVYQQRLGTGGNLGGPSYNGMASAIQSVPRRLQGLGYRTYGVGKWHLGATVEFHPNVRGFDRWYGMWNGSRSFYEATDDGQVFQDQMTLVFADENDGYLTDRIGDKTVEMIDEHLAGHADQPFYIYVSFTAVHAPMDLRESDARYQRLRDEFGLTATDYLNSPNRFGRPQEVTDANRYELAAMTLALDENIGKVIDKLDEEELTDNTILVYMTDNGGAAWTQGFGGNYSYNVPLRGRKGGNPEEGAMRVPCAMQWPTKVPAGQVIDTPVVALDFVATFVNAGGAPAAARNGLDGLDLKPLLADGEALPADRVIPMAQGGVRGAGSALRMGPWKFYNRDSNGYAPVLFNLRNDIGENNDVSAQNPEVFAEMERRYLAWEASTTLPGYGAGGTLLDSGLERWPTLGGYRLRSTSATPLFFSGPFRLTQELSKDWQFSFLAKPSEKTVGANGELVYGLGGSENRGDFIRVIVDYGQLELRIEEGLTGGSASVATGPIATEFSIISLSYRSENETLTCRLGEHEVSLELGGSYGAGLTHYAIGAAGMEGVLTSLRPGATDYRKTKQKISLLGLDGWLNEIEVLPSEGPFAPRIETSLDLSDFISRPDALVESLGGGRFRVTGAPPDPTSSQQFFRVRFDGQ